MQIRQARADDAAAVEGLVAAAFDQSSDGSIVALLRALADAAAVRASLVAVDQGVVIGHVQLNRCWLDCRLRLVDVVVLSPLAVVPEQHNRGIGTALVQAALAEAQRAGEPAVFLEGSWDYYGSRGFRAATPLGFERPSTRIPEPAFQVALLATHEPWMTGRLVYCDPFWTTDSVGLRDPYLGEVEKRAQRVDP